MELLEELIEEEMISNIYFSTVNLFRGKISIIPSSKSNNVEQSKLQACVYVCI